MRKSTPPLHACICVLRPHPSSLIPLERRGHPPIDPAPIVNTTSPSRDAARIAAGISATVSAKIGSTFP